MTTIADEIKNVSPDSAAPLNPELRQRLLERMETEAPSAPVSTARTLPLWRRKPLLVFGGGAVYAAVFVIFMAILLPTFSTARQKARQSLRSVPYPASASAAEEYGERFPVRDKQALSSSVAGAITVETKSKGVLAYERAGEPVTSGKSAGESYFASAPVAGRQVHRDASVTVAVDKLEAASDKVEQTVKASGGFVASNDLTTDSSGYKSASLTVRVPVDQFDDMLKQFSALGTVTAKSVSGEDITERMSDATQAEQVLRESAETAARKLRNNGGSEKEIRYREADLRRVRIELAQTQARLALLRKMAKLSTINVSLTEKAKRAAQATPQSGFLGDLGETNRMASAAFASAIRVPVVLIIWVLAFSPLWVPLLLVYRYASRKNAAETSAGPKVSSIEA
jgi:hypothetical protein